jgi:hypothetical protein
MIKEREVKMFMRERYREKGRKEEERKCLLGQKYVFY